MKYKTKQKRTSYTRDGFLTGQIGNVHKGVIEACKNVCDAKNELAFCDLRPQRDGVFFLGCLDFLRRLVENTVSLFINDIQVKLKPIPSVIQTQQQPSNEFRLGFSP